MDRHGPNGECCKDCYFWVKNDPEYIRDKYTEDWVNKVGACHSKSVVPVDDGRERYHDFWCGEFKLRSEGIHKTIDKDKYKKLYDLIITEFEKIENGE